MLLRPLLLAGSLTLACASSDLPRGTASAQAADAGRPSAVAPAAAADLAGIDLAGMDRSVAPGDDFFLHANGDWLKQTEIPGDKSAWGTFNILAEQALQRTRALLEDAAASTAPAGSEERKVGDFYASALDEAAVEAKGLAPLQHRLAAIAALRDKRALARALGEDLRLDVDPLNNGVFQTSRLFGFWVAPDLNRGGTHAGYLLQGGLGMPDREYYLSDSPKMTATRDRYRAHVAKVLSLAGIPEAEVRAGRIVALETRIARAHASRADSLEVRKANNPWPVAELPQRAPGLDWPAFLAGAGLERQKVLILWQPGAVRSIAALVKQVPLATWKEWMTFHAVNRRGALLPRAFVEENFDFYGRTLSGAPQHSERWKRATALTSAQLPDAVGKVYAGRHFPPEAKAQVQAMVRDIIAAFDRRIAALDWMTPETKARAQEKVRTLYVGVGYPDRWKDISGLEIRKAELLGNVERAELFEYRSWVARLGQPADRTEWAMSAQTVNAINLPLQNALNFPAAILEAPFFDPAAPAAANYGAIGTVIGHEICHSFDDQGALFDAEGRFHNWWTLADFARFEESGNRLVAQYDAYRPFPDLHVNGKLTLSENIADVAGLSAALEGWRASLQGRHAPEVGGFSGEQQVFLAYAQTWRSKLREPLARQYLVADGHAPDHYRALTVRNVDAWYEAFQVRPGQALFLAPSDRVRVW
ncbi:MAG TPA: M13 family metallopeptidase [Myxococcaceae bacterium]|nr:M13 family metallopeptidase [Myxococcaceae bacterium]